MIQKEEFESLLTSSKSKFYKRTILNKLRIFGLIISILLLFYYLIPIFYLKIHQFQNQKILKILLKNPDPELLINTKSCHVKSWPLFDRETKPLYRNMLYETLKCDERKPPFRIERVNFTWILIDYPKRGQKWTCYAQEVIRTRVNDGARLGLFLHGPLRGLTNFANNLSLFQLEQPSFSRFDAVKISCAKLSNKILKFSYTHVVPLIQSYAKLNPFTPITTKPNIILLGIDSVSRLNFLRHFEFTRNFLDSHGFLPLYGYHKIGQNSFENIIPILAGQYGNVFYGNRKQNFRFDNASLVFQDFRKIGYVTTFVEDMPERALFSNAGGFRVQPVDYYLRPMSLAIEEEGYKDGACYQDKLNDEIYFNYLLDLFKYFKTNSPNRPHFTFAHLSTLTHDYFNNAGYADKPYHNFLERLYQQNVHQNSVIILYSNHALHDGESVKTRSSIHEQRLPLLYIYIPDTLYLDGKDADQIREILKGNQQKLTSHFDLHATLMHLLYGKPLEKSHGLSLFREVPDNRTCESAGIPTQNCMCNSYTKIPVDLKISQLSKIIVEHINLKMIPLGHYCVPLWVKSTEQAYESYDPVAKIRSMIVRLTTEPNGAYIEGVVRLGNQNGSKSDEVISVERLSRYDTQGNCVRQWVDIEPFCLCWNVWRRMKRTKH